MIPVIEGDCKRVGLDELHGRVHHRRIDGHGVENHGEERVIRGSDGDLWR